MKIPLKVIHFCGSQTGGGGTGVACERLNSALVKSGIDSRIWGGQLISIQKCKDPFKKKIWRKLFQPAYQHTTTLGLCSHKNIVAKINHSECGILHLHIPNCSIAIQDITKIKKKIVWTLHDSWLFCGTEIHPVDTRYIEGYRWNNQTLKRWFDIDLLIWLWKKHCWKDLNVTFVAPSHWEAEQFQKSLLFRGKECAVIPNCVDQTVFCVRDKQDVRKKLNLPDQKKIILFGATSINNQLKGLDLLLEALEKLPSDQNLTLVCFGNVRDKSGFQSLRIPCVCMNAVLEQEKMAMLYAAADVFVCPSRIDNLPNTCIESISCGTPVAAFRVGGIPDIIEHEKNGFLAEPYDTDELANGIQYCLNMNTADISKSAARFSEEKVAQQYVELYQSLTNNTEIEM